MNLQPLKDKYDGKRKYEVFRDEDATREFLDDLKKVLDDHIEMYIKKGVYTDTHVLWRGLSLATITIVCDPPNTKLKVTKRGVAFSVYVTGDNAIMDIENEIVFSSCFLDRGWMTIPEAMDMFDELFNTITK